MSTRTAKQLIYGTLYVVIWVLVIWLGYKIFVRPAPLAAPAPVTQPIQILAVQAFTAAPGYDTFLAKIANANSSTAAWSFDYSFNTYDASGTLISSYPGESFAYPNEVKYLVLVNQAVASSVATFDLTVPTTTTSWIASSSYGALPQLAVESVSTQIGSSSVAAVGATGAGAAAPTVTASGELLNNDTATFNNVFIVAVFKDANGNPIGASQTEVTSIAPGQAVPFSVIYPAVAGINPAATEVDAYAYRQ
jgi:hypothetical protein